MLRAYKYRIYPNDEQKEFLANSFRCKRFIYNWALNLRIEAWKNEKKYISYGELDKMKVTIIWHKL